MSPLETELECSTLGRWTDTLPPAELVVLRELLAEGYANSKFLREFDDQIALGELIAVVDDEFAWRRMQWPVPRRL